MTEDLKIEEKVSPMMMQWHACKLQAKDALLLFRLGDFYEAFYEDAVTLSKEIDLTLTKRQEIPMAGIPFHTSENYIDKLIAKGYRVAVAEQIEDPKQVKGLVKREIVRIITPGTITNSSLLVEKANHFIVCFTKINQVLALSLLDLTTGEFKVFEFPSFSALKDELTRLDPKEILLSEKLKEEYSESLEILQLELSLAVTIKEEWYFEHKKAHDFLLSHFEVFSLDCFGLQGMAAAINAAGSLLSYVKEELNASIDHIQTLHKETSSQYMCLDSATLRHLEIVQPLHEKQSSSTLFYLLDQTNTPMGARLLKYWITHPLLKVEEIEKRQDAVAFLIEFPNLSSLKSSLSQIKDIERMVMRIETGIASPKDLLGIRLSLEKVPEVASLLAQTSSSMIREIVTNLPDLSQLTKKIAETLSDDPPFRLSDGSVIRTGVNPELDELRLICGSDHSWIATYQNQLKEETQIKTLKVNYTKAFGYFIEVSRGQAEKVPSFFQRKQTLLNAERFITPELKEYERKVLSAEEKISALESRLFHELKEEVALHGKSIRQIAYGLSQIDSLFSLANVALHQNYIRPFISSESIIHIESGRHPVIEANLPPNTFIPNDTYLDALDSRLFVITGPNMAGKSTFIRQVALICILAQIGSFIPAKKAHIGIIDKVFTRIGASDNLFKGQSTFMVEMAETAHILHNSTDRSLVILDEIGRGTSTYDGISIAWAVAEYLLTKPGKKAKTLFATHYYELTELEGKIPGSVNYSVAVHESENGIIFLRKIVRGKTDKSYGIHVAKLAGLPSEVLKKAQEMLKNLEKPSSQKSLSLKKTTQEEQLSLFSSLAPQEEEILHQIKTIEIDHLTPIEALKKLSEMKLKIKK